MSIKVTIPTGVTSVKIDPLYQWDCGQFLEIESSDFTATLLVQVHFSCAGADTAVVHTCSVVNNVATVQIPDACLEQNQNITAWIYEINGTTGKTTKSVVIPVTARPRPNRPTEVAQTENDPLSELIAEANEAVEGLKNGEIVVKKAEHADNATHANAADSATDAVTAQSAEQAKNAELADTADKLSFDRSMVYVELGCNLRDFATGEITKSFFVYFSFVSTASQNYSYTTMAQIISHMPKDIHIAANGYAHIDGERHTIHAVRAEGLVMNLFGSFNIDVEINTSTPITALHTNVVPLTTRI